MFLFNKDHFPLGDEGSYPNITVRLLDLCRLSAYLTASVRTVYVCMYLAGGNLIHIYVNIINVQPMFGQFTAFSLKGKRSAKKTILPVQ